MATRRKTTIHETEWDLLEALWSAERATAREVSEALAKKRGWAVSTTKTLLDRMVQKGLVNARQVGNVWEYTPALRRLDARRSAWADFVAKAFGGSAAPALHFLATEAKLSKKELAELRDLLDDEKKEDRDD
ncbi:MAG TPA: BlaI/MecI/CopY family transcriptional regulator [Polyangiaceae bacterium]|nr:BlaI/MecI/CopY family transcriptional regulator [Polyangiaceae bacterium]